MIDEQTGVQWEQCSYCYEWFPIEEITWDLQENTACARCNPIVSIW